MTPDLSVTRVEPPLGSLSICCNSLTKGLEGSEMVEGPWEIKESRRNKVVDWSFDF